MNNDAAHKVARLRGLALQIERGELDADFTEAGVPITERRAEVVADLLELADIIAEGGK